MMMHYEEKPFASRKTALFKFDPCWIKDYCGVFFTTRVESRVFDYRLEMVIIIDLYNKLVK